jgi:hypothetical protein
MGRAGRIALWGAVALAGLGLVVMVLWNWLVPPVFGGPDIGFWQALGLLVLSRILVGRFHGPWGAHSSWRHRMQERWNRMSPEQRERFRTGFRGRCGHGEEPPQSEAQGA